MRIDKRLSPKQALRLFDNPSDLGLVALVLLLAPLPRVTINVVCEQNVHRRRLEQRGLRDALTQHLQAVGAIPRVGEAGEPLGRGRRHDREDERLDAEKEESNRADRLVLHPLPFEQRADLDGAHRAHARRVHQVGVRRAGGGDGDAGSRARANCTEAGAGEREGAEAVGVGIASGARRLREGRLRHAKLGDGLGLFKAVAEEQADHLVAKGHVGVPTAMLGRPEDGGGGW